MSDGLQRGEEWCGECECACIVPKNRNSGGVSSGRRVAKRIETRSGSSRIQSGAVDSGATREDSDRRRAV